MARSAVTSLNSSVSRAAFHPCQSHHAEHRNGDRARRGAAARAPQRGARLIDHVDHEVLVAQEHRGQREEERAGEQQLDRARTMPRIGRLATARSATSATVSSIMAARNSAAAAPTGGGELRLRGLAFSSRSSSSSWRASPRAAHRGVDRARRQPLASYSFDLGLGHLGADLAHLSFSGWRELDRLAAAVDP